MLDVARVGLGALGILTSVTFDVEPMFTLEAHEAPMLWDEALDRFEELASENHHFEMFWFPHTDRLLTKRNNRTLDPPEPLSRTKRWLDDEFLANRVFGWANRVGNRWPGLVRRINDLSGRALGERRYSDVPHRVFTSSRTRGLPGDGVRRTARGGRGRAARGALDDRGQRLDDQLPGRGAGLPRRRGAAVDGLRSGRRSTSRSTRTRRPTTPTTSAGSSRS